MSDATNLTSTDFSDIDLSEIDLFDVEVIEASDSIAAPETGASCRTVIYSCSCSVSPT